jgi:hypothetical protein
MDRERPSPVASGDPNHTPVWILLIAVAGSRAIAMKAARGGCVTCVTNTRRCGSAGRSAAAVTAGAQPSEDAAAGRDASRAFDEGRFPPRLAR